ncbi:hypothetical protein [Lewinella sp. IMCC34183]|nr:hypothetical protein [Lewinella sp. IMCC34183]
MAKQTDDKKKAPTKPAAGGKTAPKSGDMKGGSSKKPDMKKPDTKKK